MIAATIAATLAQQAQTLPSEINSYAGVAALIIMAARAVWPTIERVILPQMFADRQARQAATQAERQAERDAQREREERYIAIIQTNTAALVTMQQQQAQSNEQQRATLVLLQTMSQDLAGLYGEQGRERPSRTANGL